MFVSNFAIRPFWHPPAATQSFRESLLNFREICLRTMGDAEDNRQIFHQLAALCSEDNALLSQAALHFAQILETENRTELALDLLHRIETNPETESALQSQARERRRLIEGSSSGPGQWLNIIRHWVSPEMVERHAEFFVGMLVGGLAFRSAVGFFESRLAVLAARESLRIGSSDLPFWLTQEGIRFSSTAGGILIEASAFTATSRSMRHYLVAENIDSNHTLSQEFISALLLLTPFHLARFSGPRVAPRVADRLGLTGSDRESIMPVLTWHLTQQQMLLGIIISQQLDESLGHRPPRPYPELVIEGVLKLLEYNLAHSAIRRFS